MKKLVFIFTILLSKNIFSQPLKLARLFSSHVVLQRQKPVPVWGWAATGENVSVSFASQKQNAIANASGKWSVIFSAMEAGGPYILTASAKSGTVTVDDVLMGDVWLCSGQSNMEFTVKQANNFAEEKKDAEYPQIRHFFVGHEVTTQPLDDLSSGDWKICNAQNVGDFTAVGFFFAREIYQKLHIPIGLVHSSWGGSQIESWISKDAMESSDEFRDYANNLPNNWKDADAFLEANIKDKIFQNKSQIITADDEKKYLTNNYNCSKWNVAGSILSQWDWQGIWAWRGNGYMQKTIDIPQEMISQLTTLGLGETFSYNEIYINGKMVWAGTQKGAKKILVPQNTWNAGSNQLMIKANKVIDPDWYGLGMNGSANDLFVSSADNQKINISPADWHIMPAFAEGHTYAHSSNNIGTFIYNAMIAPMVPFAIRGALWYQGETNAGRAFQYRKAFPLMINDWRKKWNDNFDFYFVQLANYGSNQSSNNGSNWAELREAQSMTLSLPKTGMAVITDIGNPNDIHPTNKQEVGKRLAANALKFTYKQNIVYCGPTYQSVKFENGKAIISFTNMGSGFVVKDKFGYLKGFEIAGDDKIFYYAKAEIVGDKIVVYHPKNIKPISVRYAWSDSPDDANLFNKEGFPASSFRTDNWKGITEGAKFK